MHWPENSKQIFQDMKLRGLVPNFYFHLSVSDIYNYIYIPTIGPQMQQRTNRGYILIAHRYMSVEIENEAAHSFMSGNICFEFLVKCMVERESLAWLFWYASSIG